MMWKPFGIAVDCKKTIKDFSASVEVRRRPTFVGKI